MTTALSTESWTGFTEALRAFVNKRVSPSDADDVLQEAMLRIHRGIGSLQDDDVLVPWIYRVTRSAVTDHYRRKGASRLEPLGDVEPAEPEADLDPAERERLYACLVPFIDELSEPHKTAVRLIEIEGLRVKDAADRLALPLTTMKARVQRGRAQLRQAVERCCRFERDARGRVVGCEERGARSCAVKQFC